MTILRGDLPADAFTIIPNAWLRDPKISAKAKGILCYIASHVAGYTLTIEQMLREMKDAETAIRSGLKELEDAKYLTRHRQREDGGRLGAYEWTIGKTAAQHQTTKSSLDNPSVENPSVENVVTKKTTPEKTTPEKTTPEKTTPEKTTEEPSGAEAPPTAQTIIAGFIDWLAVPEQGGIQLTKRVIGIYAKEIKALLGEGIAPHWVKLALAEMHYKGMTGRPSLLAGFVVQVQSRPAGRPQTFKQMDRSDEQKKQQRAEMIDAALAFIQAKQPSMDWEAAYELARQEVDNHLAAHPNSLSGSSASGYSGSQVIDLDEHDVKEVAGS